MLILAIIQLFEGLTNGLFKGLISGVFFLRKIRLSRLQSKSGFNLLIETAF